MHIPPKPPIPTPLSIPLPTDGNLGRVALATTLAVLVSRTHPWNGLPYQVIKALEMIQLPDNVVASYQHTLEGVAITLTPTDVSKEVIKDDDGNLVTYRAPGSRCHIHTYELDEDGTVTHPRPLTGIILEALDWIHWSAQQNAGGGQ